MLFDNSDRKLPIDFSEVEITRRAYRVGESEYFINRTQVRLRDVVDLLMGTGLGPGIVRDRLARADRRDPHEQARRAPRALRGDGRHRQVPRAQERVASAARATEPECDPHQRSDRRARAPNSGARDADRRARRFARVSARVRDLKFSATCGPAPSRRAETATFASRCRRTKSSRSAAAAKRPPRGAEVARPNAALSLRARAGRVANPSAETNAPSSRRSKPTMRRR